MAIARNKRMETVHNGKVETVPNVRNEKTAIVRIVRSPIQKDSNLHNPVTATNNNVHVTTVRETITGRRGTTMTVAETGKKMKKGLKIARDHKTMKSRLKKEMKPLHRNNIWLLFLTVVFLTTACDKKTVYHSYHAIPTEGWKKSDTLFFDIPVKDSLFRR